MVGELGVADECADAKSFGRRLDLRPPEPVDVDELIGPDTVNTMPPQTLAAFNDHGRAEVRIGHDLEGAKRLFPRLESLGIPASKLIDELEPEGVAAFAKSYDALIEGIASRRREMMGSPR